ncbi:MAG TPA: HNH endonuclease signature motif containing protein [Candidatus Cloacimonadota bacterium]|nr:HNH endonuclease signature motif containing protein [Candidatus Cloacimonadota bacterium]
MNGLSLIEQKLSTPEGIELANFTEIQILDNKLFVYKGIHVLVYIRDQYIRNQNSLFEYKFHICSCNTIEEMTKAKRFARYVVSTRTDGMFSINTYDLKTDHKVGEMKTEKLNVCKNCLMELNYNGYNNHNRDSKIYHSFRIDEFFTKYSTEFKENPKYTDQNAPLNEYSKDFETISYSFRAVNHWICEKCNINLDNDKDLLDTHHKNGLKWDDALINLRCLCVRCHAEQPFHERLKETERYKIFLSKFG